MFDLEQFNSLYPNLDDPWGRSDFLHGLHEGLNGMDVNLIGSRSYRAGFLVGSGSRGSAPGKVIKPKKPRGMDFKIASLEIPEAAAMAFDGVWKAWPRQGWNFDTRTASPRRINRVEAMKRFWAICEHVDYVTTEGKKIGPQDLAEAAIAYVKTKIKEVDGNIPCICCIENFFSSVEGKKHPWKEALAVHFGLFEGAP